MPGKVTLVGAGPGDPGLLTRKGLEALERADVVVYDRLVSPAILALMPEGAVKINVGKEASRHPVPQEQINRILLEQAQQGHNVVRLKGGDPFLFGRGGEELELLAEHRIPFEEVPGITSAIAAPAYGGIPVTHRDCCSSLHTISLVMGITMISRMMNGTERRRLITTPRTLLNTGTGLMPSLSVATSAIPRGMPIT